MRVGLRSNNLCDLVLYSCLDIVKEKDVLVMTEKPKEIIPIRLDPETKKKFKAYCVEKEVSAQFLIEKYIKLLISSS